ncbi:isoprenoid biosynthesis glyoxalase ElbB [Candidatus Enterovibrio altilux]|uniref:Glyoxalase n=1 Tax=Candidatus Enterovibrio altilux TaxID=1927128 RepID=A0A291BBX1_9GAMM|nr:isoprenoid biosynthesis glyoxalase ElbB [Candidatus Enterovibrio luxaltus]ATF10500.1 Sigma cross-reacting protein 27A [Candidatus Enterovibrio luxaltus]
MNKVAVLLSGNGAFDGAEINEAVLTLLAIEESGLEYQVFAPNRNQHQVINHITGNEMFEIRNIMVEAARIARGNIQPVTECKASDFSALFVVGGLGVAKNFSNFTLKGSNLSIQQDISFVCHDFKNIKKPVGYMCIAPVLLPLIYGEGVLVTIGHDKDTAACIESFGGQHKFTDVDQTVTDFENKVVTTPAYMLASSISEAKKGIDKLVREVKKLICKE